MNNSILLKLLVCFLVTQCSFAQYKIPELPKLQTSVYDYANLLSTTEKAQLEEKLIKYSDSTTTQIVVVVIESLEGEDVSALATKWGQTWGIGGTAKDDNGVIILLAKAERRIAINPGYGLEDRLTAGIGGEIIRNTIIPEFKAGSYFNGLDKGADAIFEVFKGKYKGERKQNSKKGKGFPILPIIIIFIVIMIIIAKNKNNGGNSGNSGNSGGFGPSLLDVIILSSLGRGSGGGFGGSSGGGFGGGGGGFGGGFGGGGFSGGGSSGSW